MKVGLPSIKVLTTLVKNALMPLGLTEFLISKALIHSCISHVLVTLKNLPKLIMKDKKPLVYIKNNLVDSDGNSYLTVNSLIETNNMMTVQRTLL